MGHFWNRSGAVKDFLVLTQKTKLRDGQTQLDLTPEEQFSPSPSWVLRSSIGCCVFPTYSETITAPSTSHKANILPFHGQNYPLQRVGNLEDQDFHHVQLLLAVHELPVGNKAGISTWSPGTARATWYKVLSCFSKCPKNELNKK